MVPCLPYPAPHAWMTMRHRALVVLLELQIHSQSVGTGYRVETVGNCRDRAGKQLRGQMRKPVMSKDLPRLTLFATVISTLAGSSVGAPSVITICTAHRSLALNDFHNLLPPTPQKNTHQIHRLHSFSSWYLSTTLKLCTLFQLMHVIEEDFFEGETSAMEGRRVSVLEMRAPRSEAMK
jgi:hypothetical protein